MQFPQTNPAFAPQPPMREKRRFGAISALFLSFFSMALYRDVGQRWRGIGFWYLFLLLLIAATPVAIRAHIGFGKFVRDDFGPMADTFPTITIKDGQASIAESEPYLWTDPKTGEVVLYVDTSGAFDLPAAKDAPLKLSKTQLILRKNTTETTVYDLKQFPPMTVDKTRLRGWMETGSHLVGPGIFAAIMFGGMIWHLIQLLIYGVIGLALKSMFNANVTFGGLMRLAAVAITPAMLIDAVVEGTGKHVAFANLGYAILEILFLILAVKANTGGGTMVGGYPVAPYPQAPYPQPPYPPAPYQQPGGYAAPPPAPYPSQFPPAPPPR